MQRENVRADKIVIFLYVLLLVMGWLTLCGASNGLDGVDFLAWESRTGKQLVWMGLAFVIGIVILKTEVRYIDTFSGFFYWVMMVILLLTPFVAKDIKGSRSWISLGFMNIQPAEFAKCATALFLARFLQQTDWRLDKFHNLVRTACIVLLPMALIVLQHETGTALVFVAFFLMFYREGMTGTILLLALSAIVYFVVGIKYSAVPVPGTLSSVGEFTVLILIALSSLGMLKVYRPRLRLTSRMLLAGVLIVLAGWLVSRFVHPFDVSWCLLILLVIEVCILLSQAIGERSVWNHFTLISLFVLGSMSFLYSADYALNHVLQPHQQGRVRVLLGMDEDLRGAGYNVNQAKIAIGSGGLTGKGFMNGTQTKLDYVPEQATDFIFCTVGEEEGFVGCLAVLVTYLCLILRLLFLAERQTSRFSRVYGYCVLCIFLFHLIVNIGMVIGLMPVIGIPLPLFSYGGSSLWGFTLLLFLFLRMDLESRSRSY